MAKHLRIQVVLISVSVGLTFILGCAPETRAKKPYVAPTTYYVYFHVCSDPPGAHVYDSRGQYMGQTKEPQPRELSAWQQHKVLYGHAKESQPVVLRYSGPKKSVYGTITLKKRGYKATAHRWSWTYKYTNNKEALRNSQKLLIVLDIE